MKRYEGRREGRAVIVTVDGRALNPRLDLWNHSPTGFEWGYGGSGPAQLALAILVEHFGDTARAISLHQDFKRVVVANLDHRAWTLTTEQIRETIKRLKEPERR